MINNGNDLPDPVTDPNYILSYNLLSTRDEQIESFTTSINNESIPIILMGDFNEPSHLDWTEHTKNMFDHNSMVIEWQNTQTLLTNGFYDAFREFFPDEANNPGITWPSFVHGIESTSWTPLADERDRIDYIFYKGDGIIPTYASLVGPQESYVRDEVDTSYTSNENFLASNIEWPSDHKGVLANLQFENSTNVNSPSMNTIFQIAPNPSNDFVNISLDQKYKNILIEILDQKGQIIEQKAFKNVSTINVKIADLETGMYLMLINADGFEKVEKIIKK